MSRELDQHLDSANHLVRPLTLTTADGGTVAAIFHGALEEEPKDIHEAPPDRMRTPTLVIMAHHAPGGHKSAENDIFGDLEHQLAEEGFDCLRFDFRGCGQSPGAPEDTSFATMKADMAAIHEWAQTENYEQLVYIGDGIGALAVLHNADPVRMKALVLLWPILNPADSYFADAFKLMDEDIAQKTGSVMLFGEKVGVKLLTELKKINIANILTHVRCPILVQHGENDPHIPMSQLDMLKSHAQNARRIELTTYEGGARGLRQLQERRTLFYHTRQFLARYC